MTMRVALCLPMSTLHGQTEIGYPRREIVGQEDVGALEIAMNNGRFEHFVAVPTDSLRVEVGQAAQGALGDVLHLTREESVRLQ